MGMQPNNFTKEQNQQNLQTQRAPNKKDDLSFIVSFIVHECNKMIVKYLISPNKFLCCNVLMKNNSFKFLGYNEVNLQSVN